MDIIFWIKFLISVLVVLALSIAAERISPKIAGILTGLPNAQALILFFYGLEIGPDFAAKSALFNLSGLLGAQAFISLLALSLHSFKRWTFLLSIPASFLAYSAIIIVLQKIEFTPATSALVPFFSTPTFIFLMRRLEDVKIAKRKHLKPRVLIFRALITAGIILAITTIAKSTTPEWAGLFSAFPSMIFPLALIVYLTYGKRETQTLLKNVPKGHYFMILYGLTVFFAFPRYGIYIGTLLAYALVFVTLVAFLYLYQDARGRGKRKRERMNLMAD